MELKGEYRIPAPRERVWAMLNDPNVLRECIPGCESLEGSPAEGFAARVTTKVGPVKATFNGQVTLSNVKPPESYTISGEGKGGVAGFAKGGADVHLAEDGAGTVLTYAVNAQVGGKLAQLGSRLIDSTVQEARRPVLLVVRGEGRRGCARRGCLPSVQDALPARRRRRSPRRRIRMAWSEEVEEVAREVEEEVEAKAAMGFLGGPDRLGAAGHLWRCFWYMV